MRIQKEDLLKRVKWQEWALMGLILIGIFLHVYHFRELLVFSSDQARDYNLVKKVVENNAAWPLLGPDMTGGQGFRLGPIYYYFQIICAKIFGVGPSQQAFPDLFFGVLSIPLLYYFLCKYFSKNASLFATTLYVFSYFVIEYSRFAWNVNLIPFFSILFLLSLHQILLQKSKTSWWWIMGAGIALGVGVQLHAIILLLFPTLTFLVFACLLKKDGAFWKKALAIIAISLVLNMGQFISESRTGFANTKIFFNAFFFKSERTNATLLKGFELDVACNAQANAHIVSSLGNKSICNILYGEEVSTTYNSPIRWRATPSMWAMRIASFLFLLLGLWFLVYNFVKQKSEQKQYVGMLTAYVAIYFLIMMPVAPGSRLRYYLPITIMPFVTMAFVYEYLAQKFRGYLWVAGMILLLLVGMNMYSMNQKLRATGCDKATQKNFGCNLPID